MDTMVSKATNELKIIRLRNAHADELATTILTAITAGIYPQLGATGVLAAAASVGVAAAVSAAAAASAAAAGAAGGGGLGGLGGGGFGGGGLGGGGGGLGGLGGGGFGGTLAMIGLPMLSGFIGEFVILSNTFIAVSRSAAVLAALGVILGAAYMLSLVQRLFYGPESALAGSKPPGDLGFGELAILTPLVVLMVVMGLAPSLWLNSIQTGVHPPSDRCPSIEANKPLIPSDACAAGLHDAPEVSAECQTTPEVAR